MNKFEVKPKSQQIVAEESKQSAGQIQNQEAAIQMELKRKQAIWMVLTGYSMPEERVRAAY